MQILSLMRSVPNCIRKLGTVFLFVQLPLIQVISNNNTHIINPKSNKELLENFQGNIDHTSTIAINLPLLERLQQISQGQNNPTESAYYELKHNIEFSNQFRNFINNECYEMNNPTEYLKYIQISRFTLTQGIFYFPASSSDYFVKIKDKYTIDINSIAILKESFKNAQYECIYDIEIPTGELGVYFNLDGEGCAIINKKACESNGMEIVVTVDELTSLLYHKYYGDVNKNNPIFIIDSLTVSPLQYEELIAFCNSMQFDNNQQFLKSILRDGYMSCFTQGKEKMVGIQYYPILYNIMRFLQEQGVQSKIVSNFFGLMEANNNTDDINKEIGELEKLYELLTILHEESKGYFNELRIKLHPEQYSNEKK